MIRFENGRWVLYAADGTTRLADYDSEAKAKAAQRVQEAGVGKCPHCGSTDTVLLPPDFEAGKCKACEKNFQAVQEAKRSTVRYEDGSWNVYGTDEILVDSFDTEEEALALAARNPRRGAGLITEKLRRSATAPATAAASASEPRALSAVFLGPVFEAKDPEGHVWEAEVLVEGWSNNHVYYKRSAIEGALPMLDKVQVCAYGFDPGQDKVIGHVPQAIRRMVPGGSLVLNDVGEFRNPRGEVREDGRYAAVCEFHCTHEPLRLKLLEQWRAGNRAYLGFSIDGLADKGVGMAEGRRGVIVEAIQTFFEVTLVKRPAAGGAFRRLVAGNETEEETPMRRALVRFMTARLQAKKLSAGHIDKLDDKQLQEAVLAGAQEMLSDASVYQILKTFVDAGDTENASKILDELIKCCGDKPGEEAPAEQPSEMIMEAKRIAESLVADVKKAADEVKAQAAKAVQEAEAMKAEAALTSYRAGLTQTLAGSKLPQAAIDKLGKDLSDRVRTNEQVQEAVEAERTYLAAFAGAGGAGRVHLPGQHVQVGSEGLDRYGMQMDQIFGYQPTEAEKPKYDRAFVRRPSIRDLYLQITGDEDFTGRAQDGYVQEATTANFPNLLSTSMTRALQQRYATYEQLWRTFVAINKQIKDFKTQDRNRLGGFGRIPVVAEGGTYPNLGTPREELSTYAVAKRGGYFEVTIEAIANDDLGALERMPVEMADACWNELNRYVFSMVIGDRDGGGINSDTIYDSAVIYSNAHKNLGATALSFASLDAARIRLRKQLKHGVSALINMAGNLNDNATTIVLDNPGTAGLRAGDVLKIEAEYVLVGAVDSGTQISSCTRGHWGSTAAAHNDNTRVYQISGPIPLNGYSLIVPEDIETIADELMNSTLKPFTTTNEYNKFKAEADSGRLKKVVVPNMWLGGDADNWYLARDQKEIQSIELGFWMGKEQPEILTLDTPNVGVVFTDDKIQHRVRHVYAGVVLDEKGLDGSIL